MIRGRKVQDIFAKMESVKCFITCVTRKLDTNTILLVFMISSPLTKLILTTVAYLYPLKDLKILVVPQVEVYALFGGNPSVSLKLLRSTKIQKYFWVVHMMGI